MDLDTAPVPHSRGEGRIEQSQAQKGGLDLNIHSEYCHSRASRQTQVGPGNQTQPDPRGKDGIQASNDTRVEKDLLNRGGL